METLLRYEHVDIAYLGQPAVEDVSFSLSSGEDYCCIFHNSISP